jgi:hypothetical protein
VKAEVTNIVYHAGDGESDIATIVHENDNYVVVVGGPETYHTINRLTGVIEFKDPQLANAVSYAEHGNSFIVNELWKWVSVQGAKNKEALDTESSVIEFTPDMGLDQP